MVCAAVVCGETTAQLWPKALSKLEGKYESRWPGRVHTILYSESAGSVRSCLKQLSDIRPYFTCFLTHHSQCSRDFVQQVNKLTRELDPSHPFTDTIWGILTGLHEDDVLSALDQAPLTIRRVVGNCPIDMEKFGSGIWFSEFEKGVSYCKTSRKSTPFKKACPDDATELIVQEVSEERSQGVGEDGSPVERGVDMVISSGHATEKDWNIAYGFRGGKFLCQDGQLYGSPLTGDSIDVWRSKSPKILSAAGNCLMGHISDKHCMALGWMHSANVVQMVGYVEPTWFGYGGWGVHKYFINNPGSKSFAEAFFANQQSLLHELSSQYGHCMDTSLESHRAVYNKCFNTSASAREGISRDCSGLIYDRDNVAFYGDPAWRAELEVQADVYDYVSSLEEVPPPPSSQPADSEDFHFWRYTVKVLRDGRWDCPVPDDKETCPGRPPVCVFSHRLHAPEVVEGEAILTDLFVLLPLAGDCEPGQLHTVLFKSKRSS